MSEELRKRALDIQEKRTQALHAVADGLISLAEAVIQHDIGQQRSVAPALENVAANMAAVANELNDAKTK
jgi:hypothetical protein